LGGIAYCFDQEFPLKFHRLSTLFPEFISPFGTGASRYHTLVPLSNGNLLGIWQQSSNNSSQKLIGNILPNYAQEIEKIFYSSKRTKC